MEYLTTAFLWGTYVATTPVGVQGSQLWCLPIMKSSLCKATLTANSNSNNCQPPPKWRMDRLRMHWWSVRVCGHCVWGITGIPALPVWSNQYDSLLERGLPQPARLKAPPRPADWGGNGWGSGGSTTRRMLWNRAQGPVEHNATGRRAHAQSGNILKYYFKVSTLDVISSFIF